MKDIFRQPKDAIATVYGWVNPTSGELLISMKNLPNPNLDYVLNQPLPSINHVTASVVESEIVIEIPRPIKKSKRVETTVSSEINVVKADAVSESSE